MESNDIKALTIQKGTTYYNVFSYKWIVDSGCYNNVIFWIKKNNDMQSWCLH